MEGKKKRVSWIINNVGWVVCVCVLDILLASSVPMEVNHYATEKLITGRRTIWDSHVVFSLLYYCL